MKDFGVVASVVRPEPIALDANNVFIHTDIDETTLPGMGSGYRYHKTQYGKNEYIRMLTDRNASLENELTDTQLALCNIYEQMLGAEG